MVPVNPQTLLGCRYCVFLDDKMVQIASKPAEHGTTRRVSLDENPELSGRTSIVWY